MAHQPGALPELPLEQLARVLSWLPLSERLACAPVSRAWRAAAAAATTSVSVPGKLSQAKADSLSAWIAQHGEQLQALWAQSEWHCPARPVLALANSPLPQLRSLELDSIIIKLQEPPGAEQQQEQAPSSLGGLPRLQCLRLESCTFAWRGGLAGLSALSRLQSLELADLGGEGCAERELAAALAIAWPQLCGLTRLHLQEHRVTAASALVGLSSCSKLEELSLRCCRLGRISLSPSQEPGVFSELAQLGRLKALTVSTEWMAPDDINKADNISIVPASAPGGAAAAGVAAPALSSLQRMKIKGATLDPLALAELPQLQRICLSNVELAGSSAAQSDQRLLAQLGRQTQLVVLELGDVLYSEQVPAAAYSALTASTQLTRLQLVSLPMPQGVAAHLFGAGRSLPRLNALCFTECGEDLFGPGDLQRMVAAAPGLRLLNLFGRALPAGASLRPLCALAALTSLKHRGQALTDAAMRELARLPALADLYIEGAGPELTWRGVLQLTALSGLASLSINTTKLLADSEEENDGDGDGDPPWFDVMLRFISTAPKGQPSDVPTQLRAECCARDSSVRADVLQQQLAEREAQLAERDAQLAQLQAQLADVRAQLAGAGAQLPSSK